MDPVTPIPQPVKNAPSPPTTPRRDRHTRTSTAIRFRADLYERLVAAADERDVSINWLVNRAIEDFLPRLIPIDEMKWTR